MRACLDSRQQRLRLGDLGHFGRWRKAFERRRENGVGLRGAAGRLIELGQRERREQFVTACALLFGDRDCRSIGLLCRRRIGGAALEQYVAAQTMQESVRKMLAAIASCRETFVDRRQRALGLTGRSFKLRQKTLKRRGEGAIAVTGKLGERFSEVVRAAARVVQSTLRPESNTPENATYSSAPCSRLTLQ